MSFVTVQTDGKLQWRKGEKGKVSARLLWSDSWMNP